HGHPAAGGRQEEVNSPQGGKAQRQGMPLSDHEYRQFFRPLRAAHRASTACLIRTLYGCQNPLVRRLDEYENHGVIPEGKTDHNSCGQVDRRGSCTASTGFDQLEVKETQELVGGEGQKAIPG
uniref:Acrosin-binding protein n=1 Tax=Apteryx owenii TaxID=8824 RepID=A0A8B9Q1V9_APTOW